MDGMFLPHNLEAEQSLLGAVMCANRVMDRLDFLKPEHFADPRHGKIFAAIREVTQRDQIADPLTLKRYFETDVSASERDMPASYLAQLAASVVTIVNAETYGHVIHDAYVRRAIVAIGQEMMTAGQEHHIEDMDGGAQKVLRQAEESLFTLAETGETRRKAISLGNSARDCVRAIEEASKNGGAKGQIKTRLIDLDKILGGFMAPELTILAARPGMGKTALAMQLADNIACQGFPVAFFSLEMGADQLTYRRLAAETGISVDRQIDARVSWDEMQSLVAAQERLQAIPIYIDESPGVSVSYIVNATRRMVRRFGVKIAIVDYLGLIRPEKDRGSRNEDVTQISAALKGMAKELAMPVLALAQLNRGVEGREDKRPDLSDLRDSGSIEQDADRVIFLYREDYYLQRQQPQQKPGDTSDKYHQALADWEDRKAKAAGRADLLIRKNRRGKTGDVPLYFDAERQSFGNFRDYQE